MEKAGCLHSIPPFSCLCPSFLELPFFLLQPSFRQLEELHCAFRHLPAKIHVAEILAAFLPHVLWHMKNGHFCTQTINIWLQPRRVLLAAVLAQLGDNILDECQACIYFSAGEVPVHFAVIVFHSDNSLFGL